MDDIVFDAEGGFTVRRPNGTFHVPAERVPKEVRGFIEFARKYDGWGQFRDSNESTDATIRAYLTAAVTPSLIDRGNLMRAAKAAEETAAAVKALASELRKHLKEQKEMMKFWKELRAEYQRNRGTGETEPA